MFTAKNQRINILASRASLCCSYSTPCQSAKAALDNLGRNEHSCGPNKTLFTGTEAYILCNFHMSQNTNFLHPFKNVKTILMACGPQFLDSCLRMVA